MKVVDIYIRFKNPPNLQEHMLRVAKVGLFIHDHWIGENIDRELLKKVCLLHDVGNIVKFNIQKYPHFLGNEIKRADYWMEVQKEVIEKYGTDDHEVTGKMLTEAGINPEIIKTVLDMSYWNAPIISASDNWILKILLYSDLRVSPTGIITIKARLDDVHSRLAHYKGRMDLYEAGLAIEKQIAQKLNITVDDITNESIKRDDDDLLQTELE